MSPRPLRWRRITVGVSVASILAAVIANLPGLMAAVHGVWPAFTPEWQELVKTLSLILAAAGSMTGAQAGLQGAAHVEERLTGSSTVTCPDAQGQGLSVPPAGTVPPGVGGPNG